MMYLNAMAVHLLTLNHEDGLSYPESLFFFRKGIKPVNQYINLKTIN